MVHAVNVCALVKDLESRINIDKAQFDANRRGKKQAGPGVFYLAIKKKGRSKGGMGEEKSLLSDPGSELRLGREKEERERCEDNKWD